MAKLGLVQPERIPSVVRVRASLSQVEEASALAREKLRDGYSPEAAILVVDDILSDPALARAIVTYEKNEEKFAGEAVEKPVSWGSMVFAMLFAGLNLYGVVWLFGFVTPRTLFLTTLLIVVLQALFLRFARGSIRYALLSAIDALNDASYPTRLHPMRRASAAVGNLRVRRLRALLNNTANRLASGEIVGDVRRDLEEVNLTSRAASPLTACARVTAALRDYFPPYDNRWLGLGAAGVFVATCIYMISQRDLAEGYRNYAIGVSGWLAGDLAARPKRLIKPPRLPDA